MVAAFERWMGISMDGKQLISLCDLEGGIEVSEK